MYMSKGYTFVGNKITVFKRHQFFPSSGLCIRFFPWSNSANPKYNTHNQNVPIAATATVNYRITVGTDAGKKVFTWQTLLARDSDNFGQVA
jgi:hypothetical protein